MIFSFFAFWFRPVSGFEREPCSCSRITLSSPDMVVLIQILAETGELTILTICCIWMEIGLWGVGKVYTSLLRVNKWGRIWSRCFGAVVSPADWWSSDGIEGLVTNENRHCELDDMMVFRADDHLWFHTIEFGLQTCDSHFTALNLNLESRSSVTGSLRFGAYFLTVARLSDASSSYLNIGALSMRIWEDCRLFGNGRSLGRSFILWAWVRG